MMIIDLTSVLSPAIVAMNALLILSAAAIVTPPLIDHFIRPSGRRVPAALTVRGPALAH